ncbi:MAG: hypothetical protein JXA91_04555 [Candidatus Thermoplasmatota archaeon]|nr:hypothetical protein [Candidatus Thermoplasmatota archaeon]
MFIITYIFDHLAFSSFLWRALFGFDKVGIWHTTGCGTPEVFRSDSVGKFGCSDSETWLPLL